MFKIKIALAIWILAGVATPPASRAASEEKKDSVAPDPLDGGEIAYTGGAFTPDGKHFVFALIPKGESYASELKAIEIKSGTIKTLGFAPLHEKPSEKRDEAMFKWSMGVLAADSDLETVYLGQFGPGEEMDTKQAIAWDIRKNEVREAGRFPDLESMQKARIVRPKNVKIALKELDEEAGQKRLKNVPIDELEKVVGKKELSIDVAGAAKSTAPIDSTEIYKQLYSKAVELYPKTRMEKVDQGEVRVSESVEALAQSGKWVLIRSGISVHYALMGLAYGRIALVDIEASRLIGFPHITSYSFSGLKLDPTRELYVVSPNGNAVAGMSSKHLMIYRLPEQ